jgi:zinc/manganese transport system substrate-binding protein
MNFLKSLILFLMLTGTALADKLPVVASFSILSDITQAIGGDRVNVVSLVGANQDAHVYQITSKDLKKLQAAKLVVVNGLGFEGASMDRAIKQSKIPVVIATSGIKARSEADHGHDDHDHKHDAHDHGSIDPHAWHNPVLVQTYAKNIAAALTKADPQGKAYYAQRLNAYVSELKALDTWTQNQLKPIAVNKRKVLTAHDAFEYLGDRYQISFIAPQGVNTDGEASAKTVASIIKQVKAENIKAVFLENIKDGRLLTQLSKEAGVKPSGKLYSDALSDPKGEAGTYLKMMRFNINALVGAMK